MITCKDCKYWNEGRSIIRGMNSCTHPNVRDASELSCHELEYMPKGVYYSDYEEYKAILTTGPDFGCVLGEKKDEQAINS